MAGGGWSIPDAIRSAIATTRFKGAGAADLNVDPDGSIRAEEGAGGDAPGGGLVPKRRDGATRRLEKQGWPIVAGRSYDAGLLAVSRIRRGQRLRQAFHRNQRQVDHRRAVAEERERLSLTE